MSHSFAAEASPNSRWDESASVQVLSSAARHSTYNAARLAQLLGCSLRSLERDLQGMGRCRPKQLLETLRATEAAHVLLQGSSAKEAASRFHYYDTAHFGRALKQHCGLRPSELIAASAGRIFFNNGELSMVNSNVAFIQQISIALSEMLKHRSGRYILQQSPGSSSRISSL